MVIFHSYVSLPEGIHYGEIRMLGSVAKPISSLHRVFFSSASSARKELDELSQALGEAILWLPMV